MSNLENEIQKTGAEIYSLIKGETPSLFNKKWWKGQVLEWSMKDENFKTRLFRFVDVLPSLKGDKQILQFLREYFTDDAQDISGVLKWGIKGLPGGGLVSKIAARTIKKNVESLSRNFIVDEGTKTTCKIFEQLRKEGAAFCADLLGEVVMSDKESTDYVQKYLRLMDMLRPVTAGWSHNPLLDMDHKGPIPEMNISLKLSSLYSQLDPTDWEGSIEGIINGLRPVIRKGMEANAAITVDMEHYFYKDITIASFKSILDEEEFKEFAHAGIALQAYLKDTKDDLLELIEWAKQRGRRITVRLVKGAYWDYETVINRYKGWPVPVFPSKGETDKSYEELMKIMLENIEHVRPAAASHSIRSIAHTIAAANIANLPKKALEFQILYGMAEPIRKALIGMGYRVRVYTPIGALIPGMAYLVRRLMENTSNESFLRKSFVEKESVKELLKPPVPQQEEQKEKDRSHFSNEPFTDFSKKVNRDSLKTSLRKIREKFGMSYPLYIGGKGIRVKKEIVSLNPARPDEVVGKVSSASITEAERAVRNAKDAFEEWRRVPADERAAYLFYAAEKMRVKRFDLSALMVYEVGKSWGEADADVAEAVDFLEYYGREIKRLGTPLSLGNYSGENNLYQYEPKGVGAVISPWNFPLAISTGMISAAIAAGNTVIFKPSSLSPVTGAALVEIFRSVNLPEGVLQFLPGSGGEIGGYLTSHPDVDIIAFTGSKEVGLKIIESTARIHPQQRGIKKVIAELGGKNAIIVDESADPDEAVKGVVLSSLSYQGQKCSACSRVIVADNIYKEFVQRLVEAVKSINTGNPDEPGNFMGPVVDREAAEKIKGYIETGKKEARLLFEREVDNSSNGYFVGPVIFGDVPPESRIAQEEIFGPVISVIKAEDINDALRIANNTPYALTGGVYTRSPVNIKKAKDEFRVGNLYINRKITGALVGRHPFGGAGLSGTGTKAGGPDYLLQFVNPMSISENTIRKGFTPT